MHREPQPPDSTPHVDRARTPTVTGLNPAYAGAGCDSFQRSIAEIGTIRLPLGTRQPFKRLKQMLTERNYCTKVSDRNRDFLR